MEDKKKIKPSPMLRERDYVIAYIDLLGTKKLLEKNEKNVFEDIYYAFLFVSIKLITISETFVTSLLLYASTSALILPYLL